jgi:hypothetical protein
MIQQLLIRIDSQRKKSMPPQAVLRMADGREPRRPTAWSRSVVLDEYAAEDIFVDRDREGARQVLGNFPAAEAWDCGASSRQPRQ